MIESAERAIVLQDDIELINEEYLRRRWTDGLPIIPPTADRVQKMLTGCGRDPTDVVATIAPGFGDATVEALAINAVMAGCPPSLMPLLVAATQAIADPALNLQALQATTHPVAVLLIVNGPRREELGFNSGMNCLGQGTRANATLSLALRLVMQNVGGAFPGEMDRATHGQPGKYMFCCPENEEASPWEPLHVEHGFAKDATVVSVIGAAGTINMNTHAKDEADLLRVLGDSIANPTSNDYWFGGAPCVIMSPEHADVFRKAGLSKRDVKTRLWESSRLRAGRMAHRDLERTQFTRKEELGAISSATELPTSRTPDDITLMVAGGAGTHSVYIPTFGDTRLSCREVAFP